ncbi:hypothetical protein COCMIDRAFT_40890 [Bipolaris oryzae ATCC 44560]|uniref:BTB domain-containing protein n=1 Tax=Bipolaris oryzae ATCC 44560 TaxID=930090 RepID=W6YZ65_COCMI|nr:uncharacterized protein COCMIDRAFT_40890 [Bipolaris oryzae ATCC 44560]EUC40829.1 hypothetical protein COCMIDRAFT_40890 [Bipolaris oryzae ATCC 44560]
MIQSELFIFNVGKGDGKKSIAVHSKAVATKSAYFWALMNNGMAESRERTVEYTDIEPEDFARFVEYAYRHDYTTPSWVHEKTHMEDQALPVQETVIAIREPITRSIVDIGPILIDPHRQPSSTSRLGQPSLENRWENWGSDKISKKKKKSKPEGVVNLRAGFNKLSYLTSSEPQAAMLAAFKPQYNTAVDQDFTPVFLAHARLYTFACMRGVDPLKRLTLHKLHQTLVGFQLYMRRASDIVELARYAYRQGDDRKDDGTKDELRQLVLEYIVCEVTTFGKHPAFLDLLHEGGEFVVDFWSLAYKEEFEA